MFATFGEVTEPVYRKQKNYVDGCVLPVGIMLTCYLTFTGPFSKWVRKFYENMNAVSYSRSNLEGAIHQLVYTTVKMKGLVQVHIKGR